MKKLILTVGLIVASLSLANAQGLIKFYNAAAGYAVSTNGGPAGTAQAIGRTGPTAGAWDFALLMSSTAPTGTQTNPTNSLWTTAVLASDGVTPLMATNFTSSGALSGYIQGQNGASGVAVNNWAYSATMYVEVVGWSSNLGTSWASVLANLETGAPVLTSGSGYYLGASVDGPVTAGASGTVPAVAIFAPTSISAGWDLNYIAVPEPSTIVLAGLGGLSLLLFRRRK